MSHRYVVPRDLSIPYNDIDVEHVALIDLLNTARGVLQSNLDGENQPTEKLLADLRESMQKHFRHEEQAMADLKYPDLIEHRISHAHCAARLNAIIQGTAKGARNLDRALLDELYDIIIADIIRADSGFKSFLAAQGIILLDS